MKTNVKMAKAAGPIEKGDALVLNADSSVSKLRKRAPRPGEGRPSKYDPKYCEEIISFFSIEHYHTIKIVTTGKNDYEKVEEKEVANALPFLSGFSRKIGVNTDTLHEWKRVHPEFSDAFTRAKELQAEMLHGNTLKGLYNSQYGQFAAKNITEWRDKVEIDHGVSDEAFEKYSKLPVNELMDKLSKLLPKK